jgi:hypothetical protein
MGFLLNIKYLLLFDKNKKMAFPGIICHHRSDFGLKLLDILKMSRNSKQGEVDNSAD